jgi:hypothetical protein
MEPALKKGVQKPGEVWAFAGKQLGKKKIRNLVKVWGYAVMQVVEPVMENG